MDAAPAPSAADITAVMPATERGAGRPIVFLHGWSTHAGFFTAQHDLAGPQRRLVLPDLPGHGRNRRGQAGHAGHGETVAPPLTIADLTDALDAFLAARDLDGVVLVGWSMGAAVAFDRLRRHGGERVAGLVVVDMTARILAAPDWDLGLAGGLTPVHVAKAVAAMRADWPRHAARIAPRLFAGSMPADDPLIAAAAAEIAAADGEAMASLWGSLAEADFRADVGGIAVPTLIVTGGESRLYAPAVGAWLAATIPGARRLVIDGAGHSPHMERPAAFNPALADFVDGLG